MKKKPFKYHLKGLDRKSIRKAGMKPLPLMTIDLDMGIEREIEVFDAYEKEAIKNAKSHSRKRSKK